MILRHLALVFLSLVFFAQPACCSEAVGGLTREHAAIQISSNVSDGKLSLPEIIAVARKNKVRVVILSERDMMKWEYGIWPLAGLLKKTVEDNSLLRYGVKRYLEEIRVLQERNPDMIIIPGVESAPYYYWTGTPWNRNMKIHDWHRHIMAFGFTSASDYEHLPVIGNPRAAGKRFDQYQGDRGIAPYKQYIDYARKAGALTFWTHPEALNSERIGEVTTETGPYSDLLERIDGYTGFFIFYEGYKELGQIGGEWDSMLMDYCAGRRSYPVWAAAGLAADSSADLDSNLRSLRTVLSLRAFTREDVLSALATGAMYAAWGKDAQDFVLDDFSLNENGRAAGMGEELTGSAGPVEVAVAGHLLHGQSRAFQIELIKNGKRVKLFETDGASFAFSFQDQPGAGKAYYRVEIVSAGIHLYTNPVFLREAR